MFVGQQQSVVGMDTCCGQDRGVTLGQGDGFAAGDQVVAYIQEAGDALLSGPGNYLVRLAVKLPAVEMDMTVDQCRPPP